MDWILYFLIAGSIAGAVVVWHLYGDVVSRWAKGGPIDPEPPETLSSRVDKAHYHRDEFLSHAAAIKADMDASHADIIEAQGKLTSAGPTAWLSKDAP